MVRYTKEQIADMFLDKYKSDYQQVYDKYGSMLKPCKNKRILKNYPNLQLVHFSKMRMVLKKEGVI